VDKTLHEKPIAATHWSTRTLAAQLGVGPTTIRHVWKRNGLKPHRQSTFKVSVRAAPLLDGNVQMSIT
jgi:hypothetical protein